MDSKFHIAQLNVGRGLDEIDSSVMEGFVNRLEEINALADSSPGFVWRLQSDSGDATYIRPYEDTRILVNFSVWESVEDLKNFVYRSAHGEMIKNRKQWFEKFDGFYMAMWWIKAGEIPSIEEAKVRLDYLNKHGESIYAFTFKKHFQPSLDSAKSLTG